MYEPEIHFSSLVEPGSSSINVPNGMGVILDAMQGSEIVNSSVSFEQRSTIVANDISSYVHEIIQEEQRIDITFVQISIQVHDIYGIVHLTEILAQT